MPKIIALTGRSGSGKTTLLSKLIPLLIAKNIRTGTIKQTHHDVILDTPGKDSDRHRKSGSLKTAILTPGSFAVFSERDRSPVQDFADRYFFDTDLVLLEGFKNEDVYKMEVVRSEQGKDPLFLNDEFKIQAVITDDEGKRIYLNKAGAARFLDINNPGEIASHIASLL